MQSVDRQAKHIPVRIQLGRGGGRLPSYLKHARYVRYTSSKQNRPSSESKVSHVLLDIHSIDTFKAHGLSQK